VAEADAAPPEARSVQAAVAAVVRHLRSLQAPDGSWCAELEGDTLLESEYVLVMHFLGRALGPGRNPRVPKAAEYLRRKQRPEGGWALYPGGPAEISVSVKAYFALKLLGDDPDSPPMARAREAILALGGLDAANSYTKVYLAIFGQIEWDRCPAIPPSLILLPRWVPFNLYEMSSWSRAIVVPLSLIWAFKPHVPVPEGTGISELRVASAVAADVTKYTGRRTLWTRFFATADRMLKLLDKVPWKPLRKTALRRVEAWVLDHLRKSDGVAAIFPPIVNTIVGFRCLGYPVDHPVVAGQIAELERLGIEDEETLRVQPCFSVLWDTAQVLNAMLASGVPGDDPDVLRGAGWLLDHEVKEPGDWCRKVPGVEPGGWYFEYANEFYPDCDDTAETLTVLSRCRFPDAAQDAARVAAIGRGVAWLRGMQNDDGGWAAFDRECTRELLTHVPFADHNAMLDPSFDDVTSRAVEALLQTGARADDPAVLRGVAFLERTQETDGSWFGRWGVNYVYGTWLALTALRHAGATPGDPRLDRGADWLEGCQGADGGWGETPLSYDDPGQKGVGPPTAAQTAWAVLGLLAAGRAGSPAVARGVAWLLAHQRPDGSWLDEPWTGTGFPRVFYLRYHLYAVQFPLLALSRYARAIDGGA
jgi:squalene-hopene/tetraprenyl-beta-curcumene cyclase